MPKARKTAAEKSKPEAVKRRRKQDSMQSSTPSKKKARVRKSAAKPDRVLCKAHARSGDPCRNSPVAGAAVCRMHGGAAPQVKAKASQRLIEMVLPAMAQLKRIIDKPDTSDADRLKAINQVLARTGFTERTSVELNLKEPSEWDKLGATGFVIERGSVDDIDPGEIDGVRGRPELPAGDGFDADAYVRAELARGRRDIEERSTYLDNNDADVIVGRVVPPSPGASGSAPPPWDR